jgi:alkanesulfonate monooxygenase SsuD/methylene tetrahydromethanopterin reductase-like flavin-dependent oxidoreductase (luciferase family)
MLVDLQLSSATNDWPRLRDATLEAEADGYDTTWVLDHLDGTVLPGGDREMLECCTLLGALAVATTTIGLGTLVANVANRYPSVLAAALSSAARISGGRVTAGIGAGASPGTRWAREHDERGIPLQATLSDRHAAVVEQIAVLRTIEPMPIIVGVNSVELAAIAGTHADGVNVRLGNPAATRHVAVAREAAEDRPFEASGWADINDHAARTRADTLGLERIILTQHGEIGVTP